MGRVIRHRRDYGAIVLCDERFRPEAAQRQLSCWLRGLVQVYPNFGQASGSLTKFFRVGSFCSGVAAFWCQAGSGGCSRCTHTPGPSEVVLQRGQSLRWCCCFSAVQVAFKLPCVPILGSGAVPVSR